MPRPRSLAPTFLLWLGLIALLAAAPPVVAEGGATPTAAGTPVAMPEGRYAEVNGIRLYYEEHGTGEPLLLLHGGLGSVDYLRNQIPVLAQEFRVIAIDSRGHGRSTFDEQPITYALMASDVLALMDQLKIERASLLGWSDGGIIGLELAITHPERLDRVVAYGANYDPSGLRSDVGESDRFNAYIAQAAADYQRLSPAPERWDAFLENIGEMWATEPTYSEDQLRRITTPILVLDGEEEEAIDIAHTRLMASLIPSSELILMPGTGHFAMLDQPAEFNQIVLAYLTSEPAR